MRAVAVLLLLALAAPAAQAVTKLEGQYQLMLDSRKDQRFFPWDFDSNNNDNFNGAEFRLFSQPRPNVEAFVKIEAEWRDPENNTPRPLFQYREGHLRYRWDLGGRGLDSYLFSRQDRFWVDNHLIKAVESGPLRNDRFGTNAQGIRLDTWGFLGFNSSWIVSDFSDQFNPANPENDPSRGAVDQTDDAYIVRLRRELMGNALRVGMTYNRKEEDQIGEDPEHAQVYAFDARYNLGGTDVSVEYAWSQSPLDETSLLFADARERGFVADRGLLVAELRALTVGTPKWGYVNLAPTYWNRGPLWDNRLGDSNRDEIGYLLNGWYLVPERAITWTSNYRWFEKKVTEKRQETEFYNELYIEFVNGFTGKVFYRTRDITRDFGGQETLEEHDDLFGEVQVESRLARLRVQGKIKDIGEVFQKELYAVETTVNLTDHLKVYNRFAFGNDASRLRKGIFSQLQYRPTGNMEIFLEYGPNWIGDSANPVDDGDLEGGADQTDIVKFIIKGQF